jgi:medium-chain acyl-[acyl-carrier-protein] hydrolase
MEIKTIWNEETTVKAYESDFQGKWKPATFIQALTAAATNHASHLGFGYNAMLERGMIWVNSRFKIRFFDFPSVGERVTVQTWPKGVMRKLFFMRDFYLFNQDGKTLAAATSAWVVIDPSARRMLPLQSLATFPPDNGGRFALDEYLDKINTPEDLPEKFTLSAGYSSIDMVGHVNNARYIEWITDCFSPEEYRARRLSWLQINYNNEIRPLERVSVAAGQDRAGAAVWLVHGINLNNGTKAFQAALGWSNV